MAAEIDRGSNRDGRLALAYSLVDDKGRLIDSQIDREVKTPVSPERRPDVHRLHHQRRHRHSHAEDRRRRRAGPSRQRRAFVPGGVDAGRRGSRDRSPDRRRPHDVMRARAPVVGGEFTSGMVNGYIELYADETDLLKNTTVMFEVAAGRAGARARWRGRPRPAGDRRLAKPPRARGIDPGRAAAAGRLRRCEPSSAPTGGRWDRSRGRSASDGRSRRHEAEAGGWPAR